MEEGVVFDLDTDALHNDQPDSEDEEAFNENLLKFSNLAVAGDIGDEDGYVEGQPFEIISSKMTNLMENGLVMKRILREGYGALPKDRDIVRVHYNGYIEYQPEPFDCTYARKKPHQFSINNGEVLPGLDIAVQSMRLNEKSQFLLKPQVAYGILGCLNRVPANSDILFEIELLEIVNVGAVAEYEALPEDQQRQFDHVYHYCVALCAKGKDLFNKNIHSSIKEYNKAVGKLENALMDDYNDEVKQQELLHKLYVNLIVCYTRCEQPRKSCIYFNRLMALVKGTSLKIPAKAYYNNARSLRMLGEFRLAKTRLNLAHEKEPNNPDILNEMIALDKDINDYKDKEVEMAKAFISSNK